MKAEPEQVWKCGQCGVEHPLEKVADGKCPECGWQHGSRKARKRPPKTIRVELK